MQLLTEMACSTNAQRAIDARALLSAVDDTFVVLLELLCDLLGRTQSLSSLLQSSTADLSAAVDLLDVSRSDLADDRLNDEHFSKVWAYQQRQHAHCLALNNLPRLTAAVWFKVATSLAHQDG